MKKLEEDILKKFDEWREEQDNKGAIGRKELAEFTSELLTNKHRDVWGKVNRELLRLGSSIELRTKKRLAMILKEIKKVKT